MQSASMRSHTKNVLYDIKGVSLLLNKTMKNLRRSGAPDREHFATKTDNSLNLVVRDSQNTATFYEENRRYPVRSQLKSKKTPIVKSP